MITTEDLPDKKFISLGEVAAALGTTRQTLYNWRMRGEFPKVEGRTKYTPDEIVNWYNSLGATAS